MALENGNGLGKTGLRRWWFFALRKDEERTLLLPGPRALPRSPILIRKNRTQEDPTRDPREEDDNGDR